MKVMVRVTDEGGCGVFDQNKIIDLEDDVSEEFIRYLESGYTISFWKHEG